ncbi:hypothetical protein LCGC14_0839380 [marine sediment metagenome]|uniref:Uncharacterized protein n=1 Tax=marine sediment metagenome TaxID=412755 RepID=A0A0F9PIC6_9ZZZZ
MCCSSDVKCDIKVTELKDGYQIKITGKDVKEALKSANLKKYIESCCSDKVPFKDFCCR